MLVNINSHRLMHEPPNNRCTFIRTSQRLICVDGLAQSTCSEKIASTILII